MAETTTDTYTIRHATPDDVPTILQLIRELAIYEEVLSEVAMTEDTLRTTLSFPNNNTSSGTSSSAKDFTPGYARTLLIASKETPDAIAGMALFFNNYSTWQGPGIYLEDLFVRPEYRKKGFGKALLAALAREVRVLNPRGRLEWSVLKWNKPSIDFYLSETVGAKLMDGWVGCRVDGEKLDKLAEQR